MPANQNTTPQAFKPVSRDRRSPPLFARDAHLVVQRLATLRRQQAPVGLVHGNELPTAHRRFRPRIPQGQRSDSCLERGRACTSCGPRTDSSAVSKASEMAPRWTDGDSRERTGSYGPPALRALRRYLCAGVHVQPTPPKKKKKASARIRCHRAAAQSVAPSRLAHVRGTHLWFGPQSSAPCPGGTWPRVRDSCALKSQTWSCT